MKKRVLATILTAVMSTAMFAAVGEAAATEDISGTITFWTTGDRSNPDDLTYQWMEENIKLFEEKYPNCDIEPTFIASGEDYFTKITTEVASGNAPDVFRTYLTGRLQPFVEGGRVLPIDHMLETYPETKAIMNEKGLELATFDGTTYAIPLIASGEMIFYNKDIFEKCGVEIPKTYDELLNAVSTFKENDITPCIMGISDPWPGTIPYMMLFDRMAGTELYEKVIINKQADFANEAFIQAGEKLKELVDAGMFNDTIAAITQEEAQEKFKNGEAAMIFDGSWAVSAYAKKMEDNVGFFNFPDMENGKGNSNHWLMNFDEGYAISSATENQPAAEAFLAFLFSPERQAAYAELGNIIACENVEFDESKVSQLTVDVMAAFEGAEYSMIPWDNPLGSDVGTELNNATQKIITGGDVTEALESLQDYASDAWEQ